MDPIVTFDDVTLELSEGTGVYGIDLTFTPEHISILIGPSGAGKSTLLRLILGLYAPSQGAVRVFGQDPTGLSSKDRARIAYIPQKFVLYPALSVIENIRFASSMYGADPGEREDRIRRALEVVNLTEVTGRLARDLSGGMQRRLQFAAALISDFDILVADEPTAGIDPILRDSQWSFLKDLRDEGIAIVMTTQNLSEAERGDVVTIIEDGRVRMHGPPNAIRQEVMDTTTIEIEVDDGVDILNVISHLEKQAYVVHTYRLRQQPGVMRVEVDKTEGMRERIVTFCEGLGINPIRVETYHPSFEQVFRQAVEGEAQA